VPHVCLSSIPLPVKLMSKLGVPAPPASYTRLLPSAHPPWYDAVGLEMDDDDDVLASFASTYVDGKLETHAFALPTIRGYFSGVGDLFSALVLGHFKDARGRDNGLRYAVSRALLTVQQILLRTHIYSLQVAADGSATPLAEGAPSDAVIPSDAELDDAPPLNPADPKRKARRMRLREMRVVQERALIVDGGEGWPSVKIDWESI
jgi:pyridoxine kinase